MSFSEKHDSVVYILVSIKHHVGKDMDSSRYICDVLYYNTGTWWRCDNKKITNYSGYIENVYDDFSHENLKKGGKCIMMESDIIVSML